MVSLVQLRAAREDDLSAAFHELKSINSYSRLIVVFALQLHEFTLHYVVFYRSI